MERPSAETDPRIRTHMETGLEAKSGFAQENGGIIHNFPANDGGRAAQLGRGQDAPCHLRRQAGCDV